MDSQGGKTGFQPRFWALFASLGYCEGMLNVGNMSFTPHFLSETDCTWQGVEIEGRGWGGEKIWV